ncbi:MAG: divalent-cation tolerance protein CutA [Deltaproteobacteria bacterium]|nr:divalent-cation tolerance protein CutA [Deltaproteobacteria bacterium]
MKESDINSKILILVTVPSRQVAEQIAKLLLDEKLVACVNIVPNIVSFYWWEGKTNKDDEFLLLIKSKKTLFDDVSKKIKEVHPYDIPEVIGIEIKLGLKEYLDWINNEIK